MQPLSKEEALKSCRYYKGEDECPFDDAMEGRLWFYEQIFVREAQLGPRSDLLTSSMIGYLMTGIDGQLNDGRHIYLKAFLLNRYEHWHGWFDGFVEWYKWFYPEPIDVPKDDDEGERR